MISQRKQINNLIKQIQKELTKNADKHYKISTNKFFKEPIQLYGVKTPVVRKIANKYYKDIKHLSKNEIFDLAEALYKNNFHEEAIIATQWISKISDKYQEDDFRTFESIIKNYLDNWAKIDDFCTRVMNKFLLRFPHKVNAIKLWTKSNNLWVRRASAVSLITSSQSFYGSEKFIDQSLDIAKLLLTDSEDLVQKGYGWLLKAAAETNQQKVFNFVMKYKDRMPRTALRYAIEKMPKELKQKAMK